MKAAWAIAVAEVRGRMRLFAFAVALAIVPFAATLLPGARANASDTISLVGHSIAALFGLGLSVMLGASISRDLAERRMSFYFSRPVSATSIWIGRAASSLFLAFACFAIIGLPSMLAVPRGWIASNREWMVGSFAAIAVVFFLIHALSTMIRSRSALLALDFAFLVIAVTILYLIARPLYLGLEWGVPPVLLGVLIGVLAVLGIAPVWQLANGRSDIRRSHAALMRFLWPGIAVVLLIAGAAVAWVVNVPPSDVALNYIEQAPRGPLVMISGHAPRRFNYQASFLIDRATGRVTRIGVPLWWGAQFSEDGRAVSWVEPVGLFTMRALELHTNRGATGIELLPSARFTVSGDGARVAITNGQLLSVYELESGKLLASAAGLDGRSRQQLFFVTPDVVRVIEHEPRIDVATPLRIFELDVRARKMIKTGERLMVVGSMNPVTVSGDGSRMFVRQANVLLDGRTGETIAQLDLPGFFSGAVLHDGRLAVVTRDERGSHLRIFERDGTPRHDLAFPQYRALWISAQTEDGKLILAAPDRRTVVADVVTGTVERTLTDVRGPDPMGWLDPRLPRFAADQEFVALDGKGTLILWKNEGRTVVRPLFPSR